MNSLARNISCSIRSSIHTNCLQYQQWRGIRVKVLKGGLERALTVLQRKMQSSGIERLIKREQIHHIKNSEKRVLARKTLERKIRSQDLARKLKDILIKKVRLHARKDEHDENLGLKSYFNLTPSLN
uniref:Ribosomal protein S21 family protein n=1 Tax=Cucumis melo TaxID=3656 RepID=A0A9I9EA27_CUCME